MLRLLRKSSLAGLRTSKGTLWRFCLLQTAVHDYIMYNMLVTGRIVWGRGRRNAGCIIRLQQFRLRFLLLVLVVSCYTPLEAVIIQIMLGPRLKPTLQQLLSKLNHYVLYMMRLHLLKQ